MQQKQPTVLFLISPNLGILDIWMPIFWALKKRQPETKIIALIPRAETVREIDPDDVAVQLAESVFDEVVFKSKAGFWTTCHSFSRAKELAEKHRILNRIIGRIRTVFGFIGKNERAILQRMTTNVNAICFDIYVKTKKECRAVLEHFPTTPRFSILHGLAVADYGVKRGNLDTASKAYHTTAYLFSKREIAAYKRNYGLNDSEIKVVGVPRHDPDWIQTVLHTTHDDIPVSWDNYIFVISRPAVEGFFPREKKREALRTIRKLAFEDLHAKVVVRFHPTERKNNEGLYEEVFGKETYGRTWMYSSSHPFVIGKRSVFSITFYSGVAIDMLAMGVPTIQISNFPGGGRMGTIVEYKKMGLVLGADTYDELKSQAHRILEQKESVMKQLMPGYKEFFAPVGDPIRTIVDDIVKVL